MANFELVKTLREKTGVSIGECNKALKESGGDLEKAIEILKSHGASVAEKKASRETKSGIIETYTHGGGRIGVILELLCETDFVAKNDQFKELAHDIALHIAATSPSSNEELLDSPFIRDESKTIDSVVKEAIGIIGENISIGRFTRYEL